MEIHERLLALREDNDISREELSSKIHCSAKQIERWEKNRSEMGITKLKTLCEYYGVSADYVLGLPEGLSWPRRNQREQLT